MRRQIYFPLDVPKTTEMAFEFWSPGRTIHPVARGSDRVVYNFAPTPRMRGSVSFGETRTDWADKLTAFIEEFQDPETYCFFPIHSAARAGHPAGTDDTVALPPMPYFFRNGLNPFVGSVNIQQMTNGAGFMIGLVPTGLKAGQIAYLEKLPSTKLQLVRIISINETTRAIRIYPTFTLDANMYRLNTAQEIAIQSRSEGGRSTPTTTSVHWRARSTLLWEEYVQSYQ